MPIAHNKHPLAGLKFSDLEMDPEQKLVALDALKRRKREILKTRQETNKYKHDPEQWFSERWGEDIRNLKWSGYDAYKGHQWDGNPDPYINALHSINAGRWVALKGATGVSKTYFLSRLVLWFLDTYENSLVVTTAPKADQLKLHIWSEIGKAMPKFKKLRPNSELLSMRLKMDGTTTDEKTSGWHAVGFVAGTAADEDVSATRAQGFHRENMLILLDEMPGISPKVVAAFENTSVADNNIIVGSGNPDSMIDGLEVFGEGKRVDSYRISAYDHPNIVHQKMIYPGAVMQQSIQHKIDKYGKDSNFGKSRIRGITPSQSADSLIRLEWIERCFNNHKLPRDKDSFPALGIDVANSEEGDKGGLCWGISNRCMKIEEFQCPNADHIVDNILFKDSTLEGMQGMNIYHTDKILDYGITEDCIGVDAVGVGVSTINRFIHYSMNVISLQGGPIKELIPRDPTTGQMLYDFKSLRAQMMYEGSIDLKDGNVYICLDDFEVANALKKQLLIPKMIVKGGTTYITKKEDIKKSLGGQSPNIMDAFFYWNWVRKQRHPAYSGSGGGVFGVSTIKKQR